jgi:hypothetical protein
MRYSCNRAKRLRSSRVQHIIHVKSRAQLVQNELGVLEDDEPAGVAGTQG